MLTYRVICNLPYTEAILALMHTLILLLGSFLLSARRSAICEKKRMHWRIGWLYFRFFFVFILLWTAGRLWCKWHLDNGLKTVTSQKAVCPIIQNSITTFLQTSPSISAARFLSSLCLVITSPQFGQDKAYCKLNESPQRHSGGKRSRGILYLVRIAPLKLLLSLLLLLLPILLFTNI